MSVQGLLDAYKNSPRLFQLANGLSFAHPQKIALKNLIGSSKHFVTASILKIESCKELNHLIVCNDAEEAAYFHNNLESLTDALDLFYFPSSFKQPKDFSKLNGSHIMLRTEALTKIATQLKQNGSVNKKILITYPEAVIEKVFLPETLSLQIIYIKVGDELNVENLLLQLSNYGFERTDFVYEPGQIAIRGGILDIYSFGNEKPYRIELFVNNVDSIRIIDPESQLSERRLLQVSIIPNVQTQFSQEAKISILEFLPANTIVWWQNEELIKEKIKKYEQEIDKVISETTHAEIENNITKNDFVSLADFEIEVLKFHQILFDEIFSISNSNDKKTISFQTLPQPAFNRHFDLLINDLKKWESKGFQLYLFAENPKQLERLFSVFEDLKAGIHFTPIVKAIHEGFIDEELKIVCYTDHQIFQRYHKFKIKQAYNKNKALTLRSLRDLQPGDFVTHIDHGVGRFSGLQKMEVNGKLQEVVRILYKDSDVLYVNINSLHKIAKFSGKEGTIPKINKLGSDVWNKLKEKTKAKVKEIAFDLIQLYAQRKAQLGFQHLPDTYLQTELEASFIYEDTPDQGKATADVKKDMESESPMDRLVCGDVGFGKTEIAIRAAFKSCTDGKQVAVLVPTTILAFQHYKTFTDRLKEFPVTVEYINRFKSAKEKKIILQKLEEGKIDIIIGTHGLLGKEVKFKDLGLLVIDEEQKFGVGHKEKIKTIKTAVDCLTLTATPIPRTLQFSLMGARDLSIINTAPPNRQPIQTELLVFNADQIREIVYFETERGGQLFFIHNRIQGLNEMAAILQGLCPDLSIGIAHGQMEGHQLENQVLDFIDKKFDVLVCTNIVESGVDIPNVNTIIIQNAHYFGLSDLHQLRGRVGRSNKKAFCYLLAPPKNTLPDDARKRLQILEQHSDLGSGFQIAMRDLDIRGAGNMLGGEQSGFMTDIGFETYQKILNEAIRELKRTEFKELFKEEISKQDNYVIDCSIDTDLEILIPDEYVESSTERLSLYQRLDNCETEEELNQMATELIDRFGQLPNSVNSLFVTVRCRKLAVALGFEKISLKDKIARCYFINKHDSPYFDSLVFQKVLSFLQTETNTARLKQTGKMFLLKVESISEMENLFQFLYKLHAYCLKVQTT